MGESIYRPWGPKTPGVINGPNVPITYREKKGQLKNRLYAGKIGNNVWSPGGPVFLLADVYSCRPPTGRIP